MPKIPDILGTINNVFTVGLGGSGARSLRFRNQFLGTLQWTPTANRTLTLPDGDGTIARLSDVPGGGFWNEIGSTVPTTPTNGYRWYEIDTNGIPVEEWYYDLANTRWLSVQAYTAGAVGPTSTATGLANSTSFRAPVLVPGVFISLLITRFDSQVLTATTGTAPHVAGTNAWSLNIGTYVSAGTSPIPGMTMPTTNGQINNVQVNYSVTPNIAINMSTVNGWVFFYNKTGTPGNIWVTSTLTVRKIR